MLKPDIVFRRERAERACGTGIFTVDTADALLVAGSSLTVYSGYRFVRHAVARGMPVAIINRGPTRGDELMTVKIDADARAADPAGRRTTRTYTVSLG